MFIDFGRYQACLISRFFLFLLVSGSHGTAAFILFVAFFSWLSPDHFRSRPLQNFSYLHVLFLERVEELRTTDVTSEPPRIEGLLTAPASVPGVPPFPLARGLPLKAYQQELRPGHEALSQHGSGHASSAFCTSSRPRRDSVSLCALPGNI